MYLLRHLLGKHGNPLAMGEPAYSHYTDTTEVDSLKKRMSELQRTFQDKVRELANTENLCREYRAKCDQGGKWACNDADNYCRRASDLPREIQQIQNNIDSTRALLAVALNNLQQQSDVNMSTEDRIKEQQAVTANKIKWYLTVGVATLVIIGGIIGGRYFIKKGMKA